jgi:hypothetical protein
MKMHTFPRFLSAVYIWQAFYGPRLIVRKLQLLEKYKIIAKVSGYQDPFLCCICGIGFSTRAYLQVHHRSGKKITDDYVANEVIDQETAKDLQILCEYDHAIVTAEEGGA